MQQFFSKLFGRKFGFAPIDPLANGLAEEIEMERREPQAIDLAASDEYEVSRFWNSVEDDLHGGGGIDFSDDI